MRLTAELLSRYLTEADLHRLHDKNPGRDFLSGDIPKHRGVYIGRVLEKNGQIVRIKTNEDISNGDGIEIHDKNITGNIVTYIKEAGRDKLDVGDFKGYVSRGQMFTEPAAAFSSKYFPKTFEEGRYIKKAPVRFTFTAEYGSYPEAGCRRRRFWLKSQEMPYAKKP